MATAVRPPNKVLWSLDEAITEHDPAIAEQLEELLNRIEQEKEQAKRRYDKAGQLRLADMAISLARLQQHTSRLASLHRQARSNQYDRR
jgi:chromosome segregation ATPase